MMMSLCDRIAVLDRGRLIAQGSPKEIQANQVVVEAYIGNGRKREAHDA